MAGRAAQYRRFGLPSGGPWIETFAPPRVFTCMSRFGLPSGGPWIETASPYAPPSRPAWFGLPSGGPWIETCDGLDGVRTGWGSACLRVGRGLKHDQLRPDHDDDGSACLRVGRGLKPTINMGIAGQTTGSACLRVGRGLKPPGGEGGAEAALGFGLPSGGPWIETPGGARDLARCGAVRPAFGWAVD